MELTGRERRGPEPGSEGAQRISAAHRRTRDHDRGGGFAGNPQLAREAGRKGGNCLKAERGLEHFRDLGRKGGAAVKEKYGRDHFVAMQRLSALSRGRRTRGDG